MEKLKNHLIQHKVRYVGIVGIVGVHMWWKLLQDYGPGERGRDYPHKSIVPVYTNMIKEKLYGPNEDETSKKT